MTKQAKIKMLTDKLAPHLKTGQRSTVDVHVDYYVFDMAEFYQMLENELYDMDGTSVYNDTDFVVLNSTELEQELKDTESY